MNKFLFSKVSKIHTVLFSLFIFIALISSCSDNPTSTNNDAYKIGALLPLTGSASSAGESMRAAIELAINDINAQSNNTKKIEVQILDTGTDPQNALNQLKSLKSMGITYVIGPYSSAELDNIKSYASLNKMVLISPSSVSISLAIKNDNIIRLATNDYHQIEAVSKYFEMNGYSNISSVNRNDNWGNSLYEELNKSSQNKSFKLLNNLKYEIDQTDFDQLTNDIESNISKISKNNPLSSIAIYLACFNEGTDILSNSTNKTLLGDINWIGTSAYALNSTILNNPEAFTFAQKTNLVCPVYAPINENDDNLKNVRTNLINKIGREPESYAYNAYDAVYASFNSLKEYELDP